MGTDGDIILFHLCVWDIDVFYGEYMQYLKVFKGID